VFVGSDCNNNALRDETGVKRGDTVGISAGGKNADILGAFQRVVIREPRHLIVLCSRKKSPLSRLAETYHYVDLFDFELLGGRDGFLATNSLLAFSVILYNEPVKG
jgi:hypothetical protein